MWVKTNLKWRNIFQNWYKVVKFWFIHIIWYIRSEFIHWALWRTLMRTEYFLFLHHTTSILAKLSTWCFEHSGDISCSLLVNLSHTGESWEGRNMCLWIYIYIIYTYWFIYIYIPRMYIWYTCIINPISFINIYIYIYIHIYIYISMYIYIWHTIYIGNLQSPGIFKICLHLGKK